MIRVFIGSSDRFAQCEPVIERSIRENTQSEVEIVFARPSAFGLQETGCTGFTNMRWAVPEIAGRSGFAIYLDVDMILLADIAELWEYRRRGEWVVMQDGASEVAVIDCRHAWPLPPANQMHLYKKHELAPRARPVPSIPPEWNSEDELREDTKLLHFTDLKTQPWFYEHPNKQAVEAWKRYV